MPFLPHTRSALTPVLVGLVGSLVMQGSDATENFLPDAASSPPNSRTLAPGPWGDVEIFEILLEPPDFFTTESPYFNNWRNEIVWKFDATLESFPRLLNSAGLDADQIGLWTDPSRLQATPEGVEIRPTAEEILALTPEVRARLYPRIGTGRPDNPYRKPMPLKLGGIDRMAAGSANVSPASISLIRKLTWRNGQRDSFSDISLVLQHASNDAERQRIHQTLMREPAMVARLMLSNRTNLPTIAEFWSAGGRNRDFRPLLESVADTSGVVGIDIVHLLPPVPRKLLNTYSHPRMAMGDNLPDCFSTAFNFFCDETNERLFDSIIPTLSERYVRATKPWQFGDVILIYETGPNGPLPFHHACNYVAGDLVFTKNGQSFGRPWKLATLRSVLEDYLVGERTSANFYRLKPEYRR